MSTTQPTAAILVIGDEILKGQTVDTNSSFATKLFYSLGIKVCKIVVIGDDIQEISNQVQSLANQHTFIITSGGVGPTHDDVTYEGIASAFNLDLELDMELARIINVFYKGPIDIIKNPQMKMAWVPKEREILYVDGKRPEKIKCWSKTFPTVKVRNVYIFPGIPSYFRDSLSRLQHTFPSSLGSRFCDTIYVNVDEGDIVHELNATVAKFGNQVIIGSYPELGNTKYLTKLTIETTNAETLEDVVSFLKGQVSAKILVDMAPTDAVKKALEEVKHLACYENVKHAFEVLEECYTRYKVEEVAISFNGGKDCTALLHLTHIYLRLRDSHTKLPALYIRSPDPFPEVEEFITQAVDRYGLELLEYNDGIKNAVSTMLVEHPGIKAVLMGNRRTDPYASTLTNFQMTDADWPQMMRVFPMLDWEYQNVWQALLALRVPYCSLYDQGYTSLGNRRNTGRNPALLHMDTEGVESYRPAHQLQDGGEERVGRQQQQNKA